MKWDEYEWQDIDIPGECAYLLEQYDISKSSLKSIELFLQDRIKLLLKIYLFDADSLSYQICEKRMKKSQKKYICSIILIDKVKMEDYHVNKDYIDLSKLSEDELNKFFSGFGENN